MEFAVEYQMIEQQVKQVEEQRQTLEKQIEDLNGIKEAIINIEKTKVELLKWQFGFWVIIIGTIVALWLSK